MRTLFEILPVGVSIVDIKRNITSSNPALEKIFDITLQDFKSGKHINRKYFKSDLTLMTDNELPNMRAIIEQKPINNVEMGTVKENGELIWTSINAAPLTESSAVARLMASSLEAVVRRRKAVSARSNLPLALILGARLNPTIPTPILLPRSPATCLSAEIPGR